MDPLFLTSLGVTVVLLVVVLITGHRAQRNAHYGSVVLFFGALVWAIRQAEIEGRSLVFEGLSATLNQIHFVFVGLDFVLVPLLIWSGVSLARSGSPAVRQRHKQFAAAFVLSVLITCGLGVAMTLTAERVAGS
ncbi:MAG: hypothetical protein DHS20C15_17550 [Planctomycetota bacterium]|nr:MAG: hypothetical protein DHS20C15_17550 [Planctomycetota bacterium]